MLKHALAFHVSVLATWGACRLLFDAVLAPFWVATLFVIGTLVSLLTSWRLAFAPDECRQ